MQLFLLSFWNITKCFYKGIMVLHFIYTFGIITLHLFSFEWLVVGKTTKAYFSVIDEVRKKLHSALKVSGKLCLTLTSSLTYDKRCFFSKHRFKASKVWKLKPNNSKNVFKTYNWHHTSFCQIIMYYKFLRPVFRACLQPWLKTKLFDQNISIGIL